jgi:hypothetical protein
MTFSFGAQGTREECIKSLNSVALEELSADGQVARGLVLAFMSDAPASASSLTPHRYQIQAGGHRDPHRGGPPSLFLQLSVLPPDNQAGIPADAEAAAGMLSEKAPLATRSRVPRTLPWPGAFLLPTVFQ